MNELTAFNKDLDHQTKVIQKATSLSILEPLFGYMETLGDKKMIKLVDVYRETIEKLKELGIITDIENVNEYIKKNNETSKEKNEKDNSSSK